MAEEWKLGAALLAGSVALTSHGAKAASRAAANTTPEPVSNWVLSILEDGFAVFLVWMAAEHPLLTAAAVVVLVVGAVLLIRKLWKFARQIVDRFRGPLAHDHHRSMESLPRAEGGDTEVT